MASSTSASALSSSSFDAYNNTLQASALKAVRVAVTSLPADVDFHRTVDGDYAADLDACAERVLALTNQLLGLASTADVSRSSRNKGKGRMLEDQDDVVDRFHSVVVDSMDQMLERADIALDAFLGRSKPPAVAMNPSAAETKVAKPAKQSAAKGRLDPSLSHASHLAKPQLKFRTPPDNFADGPWRPTLKHKYNAQVPLGYVVDAGEGENAASLTHPYRFEINSVQYPAFMFQRNSPLPPKSFEETPFTWVATTNDLEDMLAVLRGASEIAVDLEHHDYRTYGGFVCLMQVSTRQQDWIVDTLALREELEDLNEVFTNHNIVKVFHGAESDIVWLQRDFNLYIVNLFDTYHASKVLDFPRHGLAHLLDMYCDITPDKRYQLADWRIRPLPAEMLHYARMDTHYLLYIYDELRNALLDHKADLVPEGSLEPHSPFREMLARSATTALRTHVREPYDAETGAGPGGWDNLARKWNKGALTAAAPLSPGSVGAMQREVFKRAHAWRDTIAREEDESTRYVLPNHYLLQLAERPPADMAALLAIFHPVPPVIRKRAKELLDAIRTTVKAALAPPPAPPASETVEATEPTSAVEIDAEELVEPEASAEPLTTSIWTSAPRNSVPAAQTSSLLGPSIAPSKLSAPQSALLGNVLSPATTLGGAVSTRSAFENIAARIHSSMSIAPTVPEMDAASLETAVVSEEVPAGEDGMQVEIPFVPAAQRQSAPVPEVPMDTIVVVGQRQKKRKRERAPKPTADVDAAAAVEPAEPAETELEAFDYASAPNILDQGQALLAAQGPGGMQKRRKKHEQAAVQYGDFPAPPRAPADVKSGNRSHTYK